MQNNNNDGELKDDKSLDLVTLSRGEEFNNSDSFNDENNKNERIDTKEGHFANNNFNNSKEGDQLSTLKFNGTGDFGKRQIKGHELVLTPDKINE